MLSVAVTKLSNDVPGVIDAKCVGEGRAGDINSTEGPADVKETVYSVFVGESNYVAGVVDASCHSPNRAGQAITRDTNVTRKRPRAQVVSTC